MSSSRFIINEATCYHAPPSKVLDVGIVEDLVFLAICDNSEVDHFTTTTVMKEEIAVDANTLYAAIDALVRHNIRAKKRRSSIEEEFCCREKDVLQKNVPLKSRKPSLKKEDTNHESS
jgi:hypothetical protein